MSPATVSRIFWQEVSEGFRKNLAANSNDAETGGGARDLRLPYTPFERVFSRLLPEAVNVQRRRGSEEKQDVAARAGNFYWIDDGQELQEGVKFEPPTEARPTEGRLTMVNQLKSLEGVPPETAGLVLLLLVQEGDGKVFPHYLAIQGLGEGWNSRILREIKACVEGCQPKTVRGFIDFESGESYCHGNH